MIRTYLNGVQWGTDLIRETNPETGEQFQGVQINLLDPQSGQAFHIPFSGEPLQRLVEELIKGLTDDQKRAITPALNGGVILPSTKLPPGWNKRAEG